MGRVTTLRGGLLFAAALSVALANVSAYQDQHERTREGRSKPLYGQRLRGTALAATALAAAGLSPSRLAAAGQFPGRGEAAEFQEGRRLFERETLGGNGRTCATCHSKDTGTVSPEDAQQRFQSNPADPLFIHDGSDDGLGTGVSRMLENATVLMTIPLHSGVTADGATQVTVRRGIPTTLNTPALDPVLMLDGRQPSLQSQALGAITDHAQGTATAAQLDLIAKFQKSNRFFTSPALDAFSRGGPAPALPLGHTPSEKRGRRFFEDVPPNLADGLTSGLCSHCHSGPMLNQTNEFADDFIGLPIPVGQRFFSVGVSEFNAAGNPVMKFTFSDGSSVVSPDAGRSQVTGVGLFSDTTLEHVNAFKISPLRGVRRTAPYFHDNSARTLEDVAAHYANFFAVVTGGFIVLTPQDQADIVAFMKLLE